MGLKRQLKGLSKICFCCHKEFTSYEEKHLHRIDKDKSFKLNNMVVLCQSCKLALVRTKLEVWQLFFYK